jgi:hypothetical protein
MNFIVREYADPRNTGEAVGIHYPDWREVVAYDPDEPGGLADSGRVVGSVQYVDIIEGGLYVAGVHRWIDSLTPLDREYRTVRDYEEGIDWIKAETLRHAGRRGERRLGFKRFYLYITNLQTGDNSRWISVPEYSWHRLDHAVSRAAEFASFAAKDGRDEQIEVVEADTQRVHLTLKVEHGTVQ